MTSTTLARLLTATAAIGPIRSRGGQPRYRRPLTAANRRAPEPATASPRPLRDAHEQRPVRRRPRFPVVLAVLAAAMALLLLSPVPFAAALVQPAADSAAAQAPTHSARQPDRHPAARSTTPTARTPAAGEASAGRSALAEARPRSLCRIDCQAAAPARHPAARSTAPAPSGSAGVNCGYISCTLYVYRSPVRTMDRSISRYSNATVAAIAGAFAVACAPIGGVGAVVCAAAGGVFGGFAIDQTNYAAGRNQCIAITFTEIPPGPIPELTRFSPDNSGYCHN
jgi:hypothetical protein